MLCIQLYMIASGIGRQGARYLFMIGLAMSLMSLLIGFTTALSFSDPSVYSWRVLWATVIILLLARIFPYMSDLFGHRS